jgi:hypothetical protein
MGRHNLERGKAIQILAGPGGDPDMEPDPNRKSGKAHRPTHSLGERQKPATYNSHGWSAEKAAFVPFAGKERTAEFIEFLRMYRGRDDPLAQLVPPVGRSLEMLGAVLTRTIWRPTTWTRMDSRERMCR